MTEWLFDVCPDYETDSMVLWLKGDGGIRRVAEKFGVCIYAYNPSIEELKDLARGLKLVDSVAGTELVRKKLDIRSDDARTVLAVYPRNYSKLKECARIIDSRGGYYDYKLFDVDLRLSQRYLTARGLYPTAALNGGTDGDDGQLRIDYALPELKTVHLKAAPASRIPGLHAPVASVCVDDTALAGAEDAILSDLVKTVRVLDPDIIYTDDGDYFTFPYLYHRAASCGMQDGFVLGREMQAFGAGKKGKSYFSYGSILYKPPSYTLKGRLHIDRSSFVFSEGGLEGLIDLARLSGLPLQTMSRVSPGTAISAMQVQLAVRNGYAIPWKKNVPEDSKSAAKLLIADRGGMIFDPVVGLHGGVVEVDFMSMYPNIMAKYNISPETVLCGCCPDSRTRVPELQYNICEKRKGIVPRVVSHIVARRVAFKNMMETRPERKEEYRRKAGLLKWVLVTCFGYTGYKNARFGRIECHEAINAYAREMLVRTMELAERSGYDVLHGIIDSLWLKPREYCDHERFCRQVSDETGIPLLIEGVYKWLVFLPNKGSDAGALNRYYGLFEDGVMKVRGIELRKHDSPEIVKKAQTDMLKELAKARDAGEFAGMLPGAIRVLGEWCGRVRDGKCSMGDLVIAKRVSRTLAQYRQFNDQAAALTQLQNAGIALHPGQRLRYVICDGASRDAARRVKVAELMDGGEGYDAGEYVSLLLRAGESLLSAFGYDEERLRAELKE